MPQQLKQIINIIVLRGKPLGSEATMKKEIIDIIKEKVNLGGAIPTAMIEYNFALPAHKEIKADNFFGVRARLNKDVPEGQANLIYTM